MIHEKLVQVAYSKVIWHYIQHCIPSPKYMGVTSKVDHKNLVKNSNSFETCMDEVPLIRGLTHSSNKSADFDGSNMQS